MSPLVPLINLKLLVYQCSDHPCFGKGFPCLRRAFLRDGFPSALMETKINDATGGAKEKTIIREPWMDGQTDCLLPATLLLLGGQWGDRI